MQSPGPAFTLAALQSQPATWGHSSHQLSTGLCDVDNSEELSEVQIVLTTFRTETDPCTLIPCYPRE
jgi:hypothetical protein